MAKTFKTFTKAPKPGSLEAIEAYERGGLGHDTTKPQTHIHTNDREITKPQTHIHTNDREITKPQAHIHTKVFDHNTPEPQTHIPTKVAEPMKRLSIDMPAGLHRRFKVACTTADKVMVAEVLTFIEQRTAELERP
jgi:hypothetical protein